YDPTLPLDKVKDGTNGIWLCASCNKRVDTDWKLYPDSVLLGWKGELEKLVASGQPVVVNPDTDDSDIREAMASRRLTNPTHPQFAWTEYARKLGPPTLQGGRRAEPLHQTALLFALFRRRGQAKVVGPDEPWKVDEVALRVATKQFAHWSHRTLGW